MLVFMLSLLFKFVDRTVLSCSTVLYCFKCQVLLCTVLNVKFCCVLFCTVFPVLH